MKLLATIITGGALLLWPMATMMSPMAMAAPGNEDNPRALAMAMCIIFYPMLFGILFHGFGWSFGGVSPRTFLILTITLPALAATLMGYPRVVANALRGISSVGYVVTARAVYYNGLPIRGADPKTFIRFPEKHGPRARDNAHVYAMDEILEGADPATFGPIDIERPSPYWKDARSVYYGERRLTEADASSFELVGGTRYARDLRHAFCDGVVIDQADAASFEAIPDGEFAKDRSRVYMGTKRVFADADPTTLQMLRWNYLKDGQRVFPVPGDHKDDAPPIPDAHAPSFVTLDNRYAKDMHRVYYRHPISGLVHAIEGAEP